MLLYAIRHGDPIYAPQECLTPKGHKQAEVLADRFAVHGLDRIYSSPMTRARQTAEPTARRLGLDIAIEPWCSEDITYSEFSHPRKNGGTEWIMFVNNTKFRTEKNWRLGNADWMKCDCIQDPAVPYDKSYARLQAASDDFLARLGYRREGHLYRIERPNNERVALFCHQGFLLAWTPFFLGIPPHIFWSAFDITHSGIAVFELANNPDGYTAPRCLVWSDTSHLFKAGQDLCYNNEINF